jgi:hypothetical protein
VGTKVVTQLLGERQQAAKKLGAKA